MKEQLSEKEIDRLFKFVRSKYVHYVDVQYEIVDHLASAIEEKQADNPSLSFNRALEEVYGKFPITGFVHFVAEKQSALCKFWWKKFLSFMLSYLKLPKVIISGFLVYFFQLILSNSFVITPKQVYYFLVVISFCCIAWRFFYGFEFKKELRDKYLVTGTYLSFYSGVFACYIYFPLNMAVNNGYETVIFSTLTSWIMAVYITVALLWVHASTFVFPKMLSQELDEKYGHLNIKLT